MKKVLSVLIAIIMVVSLSGCYYGSGKDNATDNKVYSIGDIQEQKGVQLKVTDVRSTCDYGMVGWYVTVYFEVQNTKDEPYYLNYLHFELNDCYTICKVYVDKTDIKSGGFDLIKGVTYNFYTKFTTKYKHDEKDMIFIWKGNSLFSGEKKWVV